MKSSDTPFKYAEMTLQVTLQCLTERLQYFSSPTSMDVSLVGQIADAITKVSQALLSVKQLQRGNSQVQVA